MSAWHCKVRFVFSNTEMAARPCPAPGWLGPAPVPGCWISSEVGATRTTSSLCTPQSGPVQCSPVPDTRHESVPGPRLAGSHRTLPAPGVQVQLGVQHQQGAVAVLAVPRPRPLVLPAPDTNLHITSVQMKANLHFTDLFDRRYSREECSAAHTGTPLCSQRHSPPRFSILQSRTALSPGFTSVHHSLVRHFNLSV